MKTFSFRLFSIFVFAFIICQNYVFAQEISGYPIGYCNGEVTTNASIKFNDKDVLVSGAIFIPSSYANTVEDNELRSVMVGLGSTHNVNNLEVWIRSELNGNNLASGSTDDINLKQGWNEIQLYDPLYITDDISDKGFFIGFSYTQPGKSAGLASLSVPRENAMLVKCGDNDWEDHSDEGILCIEGLVYGDNLPKLNIYLEDVTVDRWFIIDNRELNGVLTLRNLATETIHSVKIEAEVEGAENKCEDIIECNFKYRDTVKLPFKIFPDMASDSPVDRNITVTVTGLNGNNDEDMGDNMKSTSFKVIKTAFPRTVFIEEFTTENCPNCPRVAGYLHNILSDPQYSGVVTAVCHHSGYGTDGYTLPCDVEYECFYGKRNIYAPAIMVDRYRTLYDDTPIFCPVEEDQLIDFIENRLAEPSLVSVNINAYYDYDENDGEIVFVNVTGEYVGEYPFEAEPRITVYLIENNIETLRQAGAGAGYLHQHVSRDYNSTWGAPVEFDGAGSYSYFCSFPLKDNYNQDNLEIVAFIGDYDSEDIMNCIVKNSGCVKISASGIRQPGKSENKKESIYSIDGRILETVGDKGLYIINGKKVIIGY